MRAERCSEGVAICEREVQLVGLWRKRGVEERKGHMRALHKKGRGTFAVAMSGEL